MAGEDRTLVQTLVEQVIPAITDGVDKLVDDRNSWRERALTAEGKNVADEADDLTALQPLREGLTKLADKLAPASPSDNDQSPTPVEDLPAAVDAVPDPAPADDPAASDAPVNNSPVDASTEPSTDGTTDEQQG